MCLVWGQTDAEVAIMDVEKSRKILDELTEAHSLIQPQFWGEPLLIPQLKERIRDMRSRGLSIALNTNGLTLSDKVAEMLIEEGVGAVMVSIDATTPATLQVIRGVKQLHKIEDAVYRLMRVRGDKDKPRIGVSFTVQKENQHEEHEFIHRWAGVVDVVRIGEVFVGDTFPDAAPQRKRVPCPVLYDTLPIRNDGQAVICCLDPGGATDMGNVFEEGVAAVWHGEAFTKARKAHEEERWDDVPFCKNCNGWARYTYSEEIKGNLLIRRSPIYTYYNAIDRLDNWRPEIRGAHPGPHAIVNE